MALKWSQRDFLNYILSEKEQWLTVTDAQTIRLTLSFNYYQKDGYNANLFNQWRTKFKIEYAEYIKNQL